MSKVTLWVEETDQTVLMLYFQYTANSVKILTTGPSPAFWFLRSHHPFKKRSSELTNPENDIKMARLCRKH